MSFIAGYLLGLEGGGGANIQPLSVTENKEYNAADYGCDGFNPVLVNVRTAAVVKSITITSNGTYIPPAGIDGYNPVIVDNPYEDLYKLQNGGGDDIDTGITDSDGNKIIITGEEISESDLNNLVNAAIVGGGSAEAVVSDGNNLIKIKYELVYTIKNGVEYVDPKITITNMRTGDNYSAPSYFPAYNITADNHPPKSANVSISSTHAYFSVILGFAQYLQSPPLYTIGINSFDINNDKYYILGGV